MCSQMCSAVVKILPVEAGAGFHGGKSVIPVSSQS